MLDNEYEKEKLMHFGVLGMKWGRRKAQTSGNSGSSGGGSSKPGLIPRMLGKKENFRIKSKGQSNEDFDREYEEETRAWKEKEAKVNKAKSDLKAAKERVKNNPADADALIDQYHKEKALDAAKGRTFHRLGKKKGQSDEDFDAEYDKEVEDGLRGVADFNRKKQEKQAAKAEKKAAKTAAQLARDETQAALIRERAKKDKQAFLENYAQMKRGKKYDPDRIKKEADALFEEDENWTAQDVKTERVVTGVVNTVSALVAIGGFVYLATRK